MNKKKKEEFLYKIQVLLVVLGVSFVLQILLYFIGLLGSCLNIEGLNNLSGIKSFLEFINRFTLIVQIFLCFKTANYTYHILHQDENKTE